MTPISDTQEFARRFNEEEAIWRRSQEKRLSRRSPGSDSQMPESILDYFDWLEAEREIRTTRAVALGGARRAATRRT
jgi:hypothetical protein